MPFRKRLLQHFLIFTQSLVAWFPLGVAGTAILKPCSPPFLAAYYNCKDLTVVLTCAMLEGLMWFEIVVFCEHYLGLIITVLSLYFLEKISATQANPNLTSCFRLSVTERILNGSLKGRLLCTVIYFVGFSQFVCAAVLLTKFSQLDFMQTTFLFLFYVELSVYNFIILSTLSKVFLIGIKIQGSIYKKYRARIGRKMVRAWKPPRMEFGNNFIDNLTPLVVEGNIMEWTINFAICYHGY